MNMGNCRKTLSGTEPNHVLFLLFAPIFSDDVNCASMKDGPPSTVHLWEAEVEVGGLEDLSPCLPGMMVCVGWLAFG